ncbi:hypothetical protein [Rhodovulum marinum]|uniref:DUF4168 domain-containing protein n=1 Tax=Rhodovulum marinum TaxID=320662 RepID=A0A4R2Q4U0_9RHOB|nr:hypothetical protein [Rhodovulum marinum]TCP41685.1 hypothetical protein EV662_10428 [Rhodovulum marinum]
MKRLAITTALILSAAAPAMAQSQLERQLGVPAGEYTLSQLVQLKSAAEQTGNDGAVHFKAASDMTMSTAGPVNQRARDLIRAQALTSDDGNTRLFADNVGTVVSGEIANPRARAIIEDMAQAED